MPSEALAESDELLALCLLGLRRRVRQAAQRLAVAFGPGAQRIVLTLEALVVGDHSLQRFVRRLRARMQGDEHERQTGERTDDVAHGQRPNVSRTASWNARRSSDSSLLCAVAHRLCVTITMFCGS